MSNQKKAVKSVSWVTFSTILQTALQFLQISILARLLSPADFGIVAISNTVIIFFSLFANLGFSNAIISKQETNKKTLSSIFFLGIFLGTIIFLLVYISSPLIVSFYHEIRLAKVIQLASCIFLITSFGTVFSAMLQKELNFKSIAITDIAGYIIGVSLTIFLAYHGFKELSLVYGGLATDFCKTVLQVILGRKFFWPNLHFSFSEIKAHLRFGVFNFGEGIVGFIQSNWDNIIIGRLLGAKVLGYYTLAYQLAIFPVIKINPIILQVAFPLIARMKENPSELKKYYLKILDLISYFNLPLLAGLYITAESVVPLIYGPGWAPTFPLIKIFVFVSVFSCLSHPLFTLVYTKGRPNLLFYLNLITLIVKVPLVYYLGKYWNVTGIATAFLLATMVNTILNFFIVQYLIGNYLKDFLANFYKPVLFCVLMVLVVYFYKGFIGYSGLLNTTAEIVIGGFIYLLLTIFFKYSIVEIKNFKRTI
ncbi:MOP flippase family protein [Mucilaginibacter sp.]|uniref:MOP flippase family protein n=1 Tax=Mucilaginibacter sp. TaxID=1882438 RepID=UPI003AFFCE56